MNGTRSVVFIRRKISEADQSNVVQPDGSESGPLEQLERVKDIHEQGVVNDGGSKRKKSELLGKLQRPTSREN